MRKLTFFTIVSFSTAVGLFGCGGDDTAGRGGGATSGDVTGDDVTGDVINVYRPTTGETTRPDLEAWTSFAALVEKDGAYTSFPGTLDLAGKLVIPGVPEGPYLLALTSAAPATLPGAVAYTSFFETPARTLDLGATYSGRADIVSMTQPTFLLLYATLTKPWQSSSFNDSIQLISRNAQVTGAYDASLKVPLWGPPADGATKIEGWQIDAHFAFSHLGNLSLIDGSKGDDFVILHDVQGDVGVSDGLDPWQGSFYQSTQEVLRPAPLTMKDGEITTINGDFEAVKQKNLLIDYQGAAFNALVADLPVAYAYVDFSLFLEPGTPQPQLGAFATLLDAFTSGLRSYTNPACADECDPQACPSGCDLGKYVLPGDFAHPYSYGNPFDFGQEILYVNVDFGVDVAALLPEKTVEKLHTAFYFQAPVGELNGKPIQPTLGLPQNIKVAGKATPYDQVTSGVGAAPEITWTAPTLGTPTSYRVTVVDLTDRPFKSGSVNLRRNFARFDVTGTSVKLPAGMLQTGAFYYFQVSARAQDKEDRSAPYKDIPLHDTVAQMFTGVVTP